jgi:2-octaprenyl-6-methoxyphenol hydroxylase
LGLRDVKSLVETAREAAAKGEDIGGEAALERYRRARGPDVAALGAIGPLRRMAMREGVTPLLGR